jgi:hypothetical protein
MPLETPIHSGWLNVAAKSRNVVTHHFATEWNGRPLYLIIPGGAAAVVAGVWIFLLAKSVWVDHLRSLDAAKLPVIALLAVYFAGLAIFSYAYELYNWRRALWLTLVLGVAGLAIDLPVMWPTFARHRRRLPILHCESGWPYQSVIGLFSIDTEFWLRGATGSATRPRESLREKGP